MVCYAIKQKVIKGATKPQAYSISHKLLRPSQFLEKFMEILEWSTLQK